MIGAPQGVSAKGPIVGDRFLLWVDGVGGYLVCLGDRTTIGRSAGEAEAKAPGIAVETELALEHAAILRQEGSYVLEARHPTWLDGTAISSSALVRDGHVIQLGTSLRLRFRQPHALSATATLEILSGHRTRPRVDGIILMSESCVLGPGKTAHIRCRWWTHDVVLFRRREGGIGLRSPADYEVRGGTGTGRGPLTSGTRVVGDAFSFAVEDLA